MSKHTQNLPVLVAGGGIGGLAAALALVRQGFEVTYLDVQADGLIDLDVFKAAIRPDTILASVMFVNNEIGVIQDIAAIGAI